MPLMSRSSTPTGAAGATIIPSRILRASPPFWASNAASNGAMSSTYGEAARGLHACFAPSSRGLSGAHSTPCSKQRNDCSGPNVAVSSS